MYIMVVVLTAMIIWAVFLKIKSLPGEQAKNTYNRFEEKMEFNQKEENAISKLPDLPEIQKQGFRELVKICLPEGYHKNLIESINSLKDFSNDDYYMTSLNYFLEHLENTNIELLTALDWKEEIEELRLRVVFALDLNFDIDFDFVEAGLNSYPDGATISSNGVFLDYDKALRKRGLQFGFIDTQSDEYVIFIHRIEDRLKAEEAVNKLAYKYHEAR